jgi:hypothetical protein
MKWKINKIELDVNNEKNITKAFFTVYENDEMNFGFNGDAILSDPTDGLQLNENSSEDEILKVLFYSIGESAIAFYEKNAKLCKQNK